jgi:hypothetical protein
MGGTKMDYQLKYMIYDQANNELFDDEKQWDVINDYSMIKATLFDTEEEAMIYIQKFLRIRGLFEKGEEGKNRDIIVYGEKVYSQVYKLFYRDRNKKIPDYLLHERVLLVTERYYLVQGKPRGRVEIAANGYRIGKVLNGENEWVDGGIYILNGS